MEVYAVCASGLLCWKSWAMRIDLRLCCSVVLRVSHAGPPRKNGGLLSSQSLDKKSEQGQALSI